MGFDSSYLIVSKSLYPVSGKERMKISFSISMYA